VPALGLFFDYSSTHNAETKCRDLIVYLIVAIGKHYLFALLRQVMTSS
jgi:hypothetical protein